MRKRRPLVLPPLLWVTKRTPRQPRIGPPKSVCMIEFSRPTSVRLSHHGAVAFGRTVSGIRSDGPRSPERVGPWPSAVWDIPDNCLPTGTPRVCANPTRLITTTRTVTAGPQNHGTAALLALPLSRTHPSVTTRLPDPARPSCPGPPPETNR